MEDHRPAVLVVEDEPLIRLNAVEILADAGVETIEAGDAQEALALLDRHPEIRILFTDINMPGPLDGLALARKVHSARSDVRLILTSGRVWPARTEIPDHGQFVPKPYQASTLTRLVKELL